MKHAIQKILPALLAVGLAAAVQASPEDAPCAPRGPCGQKSAACQPPRGPAFRPPHENREAMDAHKATRRLARQAREAQGEERERLVAELREQVRLETQMIDRLQEERLDAIEKAAQERFKALRAELAAMRENQDAFIDEQVERYLQGPAACRGKFAPPEDAPDGFEPPPEGEDGPAFDGHRPPPPHHPRHGHGPRGPRFGSPCPPPPPPCATSPEGGPLPDAPLGIPAPAVEPPPAETPAD